MKSDNSDVIITWKKYTKKMPTRCQQDANNMPKLTYFRKQGFRVFLDNISYIFNKLSSFIEI